MLIPIRKYVILFFVGGWEWNLCVVWGCLVFHLEEKDKEMGNHLSNYFFFFLFNLPFPFPSLLFLFLIPSANVVSIPLLFFLFVFFLVSQSAAKVIDIGQLAGERNDETKADSKPY